MKQSRMIRAKARERERDLLQHNEEEYLNIEAIYIEFGCLHRGKEGRKVDLDRWFWSCVIYSSQNVRKRNAMYGILEMDSWCVCMLINLLVAR